MDCTTVTLTHIGIGFGLLFLGLIIGLAANLERIGRVARWKAGLERGSAQR